MFLVFKIFKSCLSFRHLTCALIFLGYNSPSLEDMNSYRIKTLQDLFIHLGCQFPLTGVWSIFFIPVIILETEGRNKTGVEEIFVFFLLRYPRLVSNTFMVICLPAPPKWTEWTFLFSLHVLFCKAKLILNFSLPGIILGCLILFLSVVYSLFHPLCKCFFRSWIISESLM